ncbi:hypothetical protein TYRP_000748 [Tyrophagus putrescentiae]|nr:hypothetical protein TYRP_000748 [Tyrophagus putrescentiae]
MPASTGRPKWTSSEWRATEKQEEQVKQEEQGFGHHDDGCRCDDDGYHLTWHFDVLEQLCREIRYDDDVHYHERQNGGLGDWPICGDFESGGGGCDHHLLSKIDGGSWPSRCDCLIGGDGFGFGEHELLFYRQAKSDLRCLAKESLILEQNCENGGGGGCGCACCGDDHDGFRIVLRRKHFGVGDDLHYHFDSCDFHGCLKQMQKKSCDDFGVDHDGHDDGHGYGYGCCCCFLSASSKSVLEGTCHFGGDDDDVQHFERFEAMCFACFDEPQR